VAAALAFLAAKNKQEKIYDRHRFLLQFLAPLRLNGRDDCLRVRFSS
jgi:hypothetical protein